MTSEQLLHTYVQTMQTEAERYLGLMVVFSVSEVTVPYDQLEADLTRLGLAQHIPGRPGAADIFRRASKALQTTKPQPIPNEPDKFVNVMIRDLANNEDEIVRRMVCEVVDKANRQLGYEETWEFTFTKANRKLHRSDSLEVRRVGPSPHPYADELADGLVRDYNRLTGTVNGDGIRRVISNVLEATHAVSLRPGGGCWFADRSEATTIASLERFASTVAGTQVHTIPLIDDTKQRENLLAAVEERSKADIERAQAEVAELLAKGEPVSARVMASQLARFKDIEERATRYQGLLETTLGTTRMGLGILKLQMAKLVGVTGAANPSRLAA